MWARQSRSASIGVALGGATRESVNGDVVRTLDSIRAGFQRVPLVSQGLEVGPYSTPWGSTARVIVAGDASIFTWSDTPITVTMQTTTPKTYEDGEVVGTVTWTAGPNIDDRRRSRSTEASSRRPSGGG